MRVWVVLVSFSVRGGRARDLWITIITTATILVLVLVGSSSIGVLVITLRR